MCDFEDSEAVIEGLGDQVLELESEIGRKTFVIGEVLNSLIALPDVPMRDLVESVDSIRELLREAL